MVVPSLWGMWVYFEKISNDSKLSGLDVSELSYVYFKVKLYDIAGTEIFNEYAERGTDARFSAEGNTDYTKFKGWSHDLDNVQESFFATAEYNDCAVTFKDYDGTVVSEQSIKFGQSAEAPETPDNREGYHFVKWDSDFLDVKDDQVITAQYKINKYEVQFIGKDGNQLFESQSVQYGDYADRPDTGSLVDDEKYFVRWDKDFAPITENTIYQAVFEYYYEHISSDDGVIITKCNLPDEKILTIPDTIEGAPVIGIGEKAFKDCTALTKITIPASVKNIADDIFDGCDVSKIQICGELGSSAEEVARKTNVAFEDLKTGEVISYSDTSDKTDNTEASEGGKDEGKESEDNPADSQEIVPSEHGDDLEDSKGTEISQETSEGGKESEDNPTDSQAAAPSEYGDGLEDLRETKISPEKTEDENDIMNPVYNPVNNESSDSSGSSNNIGISASDKSQIQTSDESINNSTGTDVSIADSSDSREKDVKKKIFKLSSVKIKSNRLTGKISVQKANIKIKLGKGKKYKKANVKGKKFTLKYRKLKKRTTVVIKVTKKGYKTLIKKYTFK